MVGLVLPKNTLNWAEIPGVCQDQVVQRPRRRGRPGLRLQVLPRVASRHQGVPGQPGLPHHTHRVQPGGPGGCQCITVQNSCKVPKSLWLFPTFPSSFAERQPGSSGVSGAGRGICARQEKPLLLQEACQGRRITHFGQIHILYLQPAFVYFSS